MHNQIYLPDKMFNTFGNTLSLTIVKYQTAILQGNVDAAAELLSSVPKEHRNKVTPFLEAQGQSSSTQSTSLMTPLGRPDHKGLALQVMTDPDHKFNLSLLLDNLDSAHEIACSVPALEGDMKWKAIGD